jgi:RES domain-containing protein
MTIGAKTAELAEPERSEIAAMRHDVVANGCWRDAASFQAEPTQWFDHELMRSAACPAGGAVPAMDVRRVRHRGKHARQTRVRARTRPGIF